MLPDHSSFYSCLVWEALKSKTGKSKEQIEKEHWGKSAKDSKEGADSNSSQGIDKSGEAEYNKEKREKAINEMLNSDRIKTSETLTKETIKKNLSCGTEEMQETTARLFNEDSFSYENKDGTQSAYYSYSDNRIEYSMEMKEAECYKEGSVLYHESWHAIDFNYGGVQHTPFGDWEERLSTDYKLSSGKTFNSTLLEETRTVGWEDLVVEINNVRQEELRKAGFNTEEYDIVYQRQVELYNDFLNARPENLQEAHSAYLAETQRLRLLETKRELVLKLINPIIKRNYGDMSDIYSGFTKGRAELCGMGHKKEYWLTEGRRAHEAFAEIASAKATNPESYELFKKHLPKTVEAFEEIYGKLKSGEIKARK